MHNQDVQEFRQKTMTLREALLSILYMNTWAFVDSAMEEGKNLCAVQFLHPLSLSLVQPFHQNGHPAVPKGLQGQNLREQGLFFLFFLTNFTSLQLHTSSH